MGLNEQTIMAELCVLMEEEGFLVFQPEVQIIDQKLCNFILKTNDHQFIVEIEIDQDSRNLIEVLLQASQYTEDLKRQGIHIDGFIYAIYPQSAIVQVSSENQAKEEARRIIKKVELNKVIILPPFMDVHSEITILSLLRQLKMPIDMKEISIKSVIEFLREAVETTQKIFFKILNVSTEIVDTLVSDFNHFRILTEDGTNLGDIDLLKVIARMGVYILINQFLFYHLLVCERRNISDFTLMELHPDISLNDISNQFERVLDYNYSPIYSIKIVNYLKRSEFQEEAQRIISICIHVIKAIQPEKIKHDMLGLVYQELIPVTLRKMLATFFTKTNAAEILCSLIITKWDQKVFDPACGSGMILTTAYKKKMSLLDNQQRKNKELFHKQFIEKDLTGIDVMPFSAHLTAMNLNIQQPLINIKNLRVGIDDSLNLNPDTNVEALVGTKLQPHFQEESKSISLIREQKEIGFKIGKVNSIIMNPPFTKKRRLSDQMKIPLKLKWWIKLGNLHYWAHFVLNSISFLEKDGDIGAILPLGMIALKDGMIVDKELGRHDFKPKYIVKSMRNIAFSESAKFRDYIITFEKTNKRDCFACVYLLKSLDNISSREAREIGTNIIAIPSNTNYEDEKLSIIWIKFEDIKRFDSLWEIVELHDPIGRNILEKYLKIIIDNPHLIYFENYLKDEEMITYFSPALLKGGVRHAIFLGKNERTRTQLLIEESSSQHFISFSVRNSKIRFKAPKSKLITGLKTDSYVSQMNAGGDGKVIANRYKGFENVEQFFNTKVNFKEIKNEIERTKGEIAISRRFDFTAEGFRLFCFFSEDFIVATENLWTIRTRNFTDAKILTLWLNSTLFLMELIFSKRKETRGSFSQVDKYKILKFHVPDLNKLSQEEKSILIDLFEELKDINMPPLLTQLREFDQIRVRIDKELLKIFGFKEQQISEILPILYHTLLEKCLELMHVMNPQ